MQEGQWEKRSGEEEEGRELWLQERDAEGTVGKRDPVMRIRGRNCEKEAGGTVGKEIR